MRLDHIDMRKITYNFSDWYRADGRYEVKLIPQEAGLLSCEVSLIESLFVQEKQAEG